MSNKLWKKQHYGNPQKNKLLEWNTFGVFFTAEYEKDGVREANNLLSKYLNEPTVSEVNDDEEGDISDMLKKAAEEASKPTTVKRIRQQPTGIKHCLFFTLSDIAREDINDIVDKLVNDCQTVKQCRFLQRCIPVEDVSSDDILMLKPKLQKIISRQYQLYKENKDNDGKHATFAVDFKARFSEYKRQDALDVVCEVIKDIDPDSKVNLTTPDFTIMFHVIKKAVLLSCVKDYSQRRKFNLSPPEEKVDKTTNDPIPQDNPDIS